MSVADGQTCVEHDRVPHGVVVRPSLEHLPQHGRILLRITYDITQDVKVQERRVTTQGMEAQDTSSQGQSKPGENIRSTFTVLE